MYTSLATEAQLAPIDNARAEFRRHWCSFQQMPFVCDFAGTLDDVTALDYVDYEGLGYPPSNIDGSALVWGNVIATQLGLTWVVSYRGDLLLTHEAPGNRITVWPFARVLELRERSLPQFGRYAWLLDRTIRDGLHYGDLSDNARAWCQGVLGGWEKEGTPWS